MWKRLVKLAEGPNITRTQAEVAHALAPYENSLRAAGHTLQLLLHPASTSSSSSATWSEHGIVSWARGLPEADAHDRDTLAKVHDEVMSILWSALPQPSLATQADQSMRETHQKKLFSIKKNFPQKSKNFFSQSNKSFSQSKKLSLPVYRQA